MEALRANLPAESAKADFHELSRGFIPSKFLFKYKLHDDAELFEKAYGYIKEYY